MLKMTTGEVELLILGAVRHALSSDEIYPCLIIDTIINNVDNITIPTLNQILELIEAKAEDGFVCHADLWTNVAEKIRTRKQRDEDNNLNDINRTIENHIFSSKEIGVWYDPKYMIPDVGETVLCKLANGDYISCKRFPNVDERVVWKYKKPNGHIYCEVRGVRLWSYL